MAPGIGTPRVAVDAMGGDRAPREIVAGAVAAAKTGGPVFVVGDELVLRPLVPLRSSVVIVHAAGRVAMDASPRTVRGIKDASVRVCARMVADGRVDGMVSCGNTGATLMAAVLEIGVLDDVQRPALATVLPRSDGGRLILLDAGANVDCRPELLASFALLGAAHAELLGIDSPRVGLLSIGEEDGKGNSQVRAALPALRALPLNVVGNVEPSAAMSGACDVLVCDGFVGNVLVKAAEGAVSTVGGILRAEIHRYWSGRVGAFLLRGALARFRARVSWDALGGAQLLGTPGVVIVGHGRSSAEAVTAAIESARHTCRADLPAAVRRYVAAARAAEGPSP
ncbi:MAG: glycerol-3-phosphate acyltransferase PlsX [Myxococcota bacterium]